MSINTGDIVKFIRQKDYVYEKVIGKGGTSKTVLLTDDILNLKIVCKAYDPATGNDPDYCFKKFIDEIGILFTLSHINIVRIFNYYLYPANKKGYILMEYIDGESLDAYTHFADDTTFANIFIQAIEGFNYLEKNKVLHRDIKPDNFIVDNNGVLKIIDFGFGKISLQDSVEKASIMLNWPVSKMPEEIYNRIYNHRTEIYFLGKMFEKLCRDNFSENSRYKDIINKMADPDPIKRPSSFAEILDIISDDIFEYTHFSQENKEIYTKIADSLLNAISCHNDSDHKFARNIDEIKDGLKRIIEESALEEIVQDNKSLINCVIKSSYSYNPKIRIKVDDVKNFYRMLIQLSGTQQNIVYSNLMARLRSIETQIDDDIVLPFDL